MLRTPMLRAAVVFFVMACVAGVIAYWYGDAVLPGPVASMASVAFIIFMVMALLAGSIGLIPHDRRNRAQMY